MISKVYVIACDQCKASLQILNGAQSVGSAFKAAKKLPWERNGTNTKHRCPECMSKSRQEVKTVDKVNKADELTEARENG